MKTFNSIYDIENFFETATAEEKKHLIERAVKHFLHREFRETVERASQINQMTANASFTLFHGKSPEEVAKKLTEYAYVPSLTI